MNQKNQDRLAPIVSNILERVIGSDIPKRSALLAIMDGFFQGINQTVTAMLEDTPKKGSLFTNERIQTAVVSCLLEKLREFIMSGDVESLRNSVQNGFQATVISHLLKNYSQEFLPKDGFIFDPQKEVRNRITSLRPALFPRSAA
ncbi:hypothetical protein HZA38_01370 [Candidatus Peregrinibacteria bacterium]|nr:hypothetical protein [Candidatus Peregrinibacteria bacterium]